VDSTALKTVQRDAMRFSMTYGASAVEFVNSTAEISGAIDGLTSTDLPQVTKVANTLAFALKATSSETAEFMGQMFANFRSDAERLGKVQFAEQLAGKMAYMRQTFGVEMGAIKDLMEGARGVGTNFNIGLDEQLAVLGQLNRTLGSEASSAYEGFMTGAIDGAKKLGLSFTDMQGNILSMPEMLMKLQGKYGKSLEGNLKAQAELDEAFGDSSAVVKQLYGNVALLQRNINELGGADGLKRTQEMAAKMVKPWDRFVQILKAIQTVIGLTLVPVLYPLLNRLADMGQTFARWMQIFPNIARVVGYAALAILGFAAAGASANIILGLSSFILTGLKALWYAVTLPVRLFTGAVWLARGAIVAWNAMLGVLRGVLLAVRIAAVLAGVGINFMSWPVLLIIGAIALLVAGCWLLVKHWDAIKAAVMETAAFQAVVAAVKWVADMFGKAWQFIAEGWEAFTKLLSGFSPAAALADMAIGIVNVFSNIWSTITESFSKAWKWIVDKLNNIPGVNIPVTAEIKQVDALSGAGAVPKNSAFIYSGANAAAPVKTDAAPLTANTLSTGGQVKNLDKGGISKTINNNGRTVTDNSRKINTVNIYPKETLSPGQLMEWQELG
ncbi:phage tail tape measure protein, partial [Cronobacter sakazakii]|nr:phage tail tape measure protein [Cronobacter sakazakii]